MLVLWYLTYPKQIFMNGITKNIHDSAQHKLKDTVELKLM